MSNIFPNTFRITQKERSLLLNQKPLLIWFTGLSGSGKSTLANRLEIELCRKGIKTYLLDGDNLRSGLNKDLGFSDEDRVENIRRVGEVSRLMLDAGLVVIAAFIAPFQSDRDMVKKMVREEYYFEIYMDCPLEICESRDPKGLYQKARNGLINNFTGIDSPYEIPSDPKMSINSYKESETKALDRILISLPI